MKITIQNYDRQVTVDTGHDDMDIYEVGTELRYLLVAVGFHPESVKEILPEEE